MAKTWRRCLPILILVAIVYGLCIRRRYFFSSNFSALIFWISFSCLDFQVLHKMILGEGDSLYAPMCVSWNSSKLLVISKGKERWVGFYYDLRIVIVTYFIVIGDRHRIRWLNRNGAFLIKTLLLFYPFKSLICFFRFFHQDIFQDWIKVLELIKKLSNF